MSASGEKEGQGWKSETIEELVKPNQVAYGVVKAGPDVADGIPLIRVGDIRNDSIDSSNLYKISEDVASTYPRSRLVGGEVLITVQGSVGRTAIVPDILSGSVFSRTVAVLRFEDANIAKWVNAVFQTRPLQERVRQLSAASTKDLLNLRDLRKIEIYLPEPSAIVEILQRIDEASAAYRQAISDADAAIASLRLFLQQLPVEAYDGRLWQSENGSTLPSVTRPMNEIASSSLGKMLDQSRNRGELRPYLRNANVQWDSINTSDILSMRISDHEAERFRLQTGDVMVCEGGEPGRAAVWESDREMYFQKALHRVRCGPDLDPSWLVLALKASSSSGALDPYLTGSGIMHLTGRAFANVPISLPSLKKQREILSRVRHLSSEGQLMLEQALRSREYVAAAYQDFLAQELLPVGYNELKTPTHRNPIDSAAPGPQEVSEVEYPKLTLPRSSERNSQQKDHSMVSIRSIIESLGGSASAVDVLNSPLFTTTIDEFYIQLREEIAEGSLEEVVINEHKRLLQVIL